MVEMLGVLAIIGVLSVGGIAGYSLSMRRHRANGVTDIVSKYALILYNQCQQKILNGEITGESSSEIMGCEGTRLIKFSDAGVGAMPAGVSSIVGGGVRNDEKTGVDTSNVAVKFSDMKLCKAVESITGTSYSSTGQSECERFDGYITISIKQN